MERRKNLNDKFGFVETVKELLKNIAVIGAGQGAPQGKENYCDEGIPFIKAGNLQELIEGKNINFIQKVSEGVVRKYKLKKYPKGTILFAKSGMSCMKGYVYVLPQEACVVSHLACITPKLEVSDYLRYYFLFNKPNTLVKDVSYPSISLQDIGELKISIKTDLERNKIVGTLKCIENNISMRKNELRKYDELIKARFVEMFGNIDDYTKWEPKPWSEVVTIQNGRDYKKIAVNCGGFPVYGTGGEIARASEYLCSENTIIVGRKGSINNPLLVKEKYWNVDTAFGIIPNYKFLHYQYFYMFCKFFNFNMLNKATTLPSTTKTDLLKIMIKIPPLELQNQFADFVEQVDKSKLAVQQSLKKTQLLFDSLMQEYFGEN